VKRLCRIFVVVTIICAGVLFFLSTAFYRRLSAAELRFDKRWTPRIPTSALKPADKLRMSLIFARLSFVIPSPRLYPKTCVSEYRIKRPVRHVYVATGRFAHTDQKSVTRKPAELGSLLHIDWFI